MAQDRFARASLLQGAVAPASAGNVSVGVGKDPALAEESSFYNTLSKRMDVFHAESYKLASAQAKAAGAAYGARNAPTQEQLAKAQMTGEVIDLPGDATSINIFNQAAYASSLSMLEDSVEIAGRRALASEMAKAAENPNLDPREFTAQLDTVVQEYSTMMANVSPSSGGKVGASLSMVANSQVVSFSREYMARAIKAQTNEAKEQANVFVDGSAEVITGHQAEGDVTLLDKIKQQRSRIRSILEKAPNVTEDYILRVERRFDKNVAAAQQAVVLNWARTTPAYINSPTAAARELRKHASGKASTLPQHIKDVWDITTVQTRGDIFDSIIKQSGQLNRLDELDNARTRANREQFILDQTIAFDKARRDGFNVDKMKTAINLLSGIGAVDLAEKFQKQLDAGPVRRTVSAANDLKRLRTARALGTLTYQMIEDANLNEIDIGNFMRDLTSQRDKNVKQAEARIKNSPMFKNLPLDDNVVLNTKQKVIRQRFLDAKERLLTAKHKFEEDLENKVREGSPITADDYFNADNVADQIVIDIRKQITETEIKSLQRKVDRGYKLIESVGDGYPDNIIGLENALNHKEATLLGAGPMERIFKPNSSGKYIGNGAKIQAAIKAYRRIEALQEMIEELDDDE